MVERYVHFDSIEKIKSYINKIVMIDSDVDLVYHHYILDAKSIMAIFSIDLSGDLKLVLHSDDEDEIQRFNEIISEVGINGESNYSS